MTALSIGRRLIVIAGTPGAGKSTFGRALAARIGALLLDLDTVTNPMFRAIASLVGADDDFDNPALQGTVRAARYQCLWDVARANAELGHVAVLVGPFTAEVASASRWRSVCAQQAPGLGVSLIQVVLSAEQAALRRRMRDLPRDRAFHAATLRPVATPPPATIARHADFHVDGAAETDSEVARIVPLLGGSSAGFTG